MTSVSDSQKGERRVALMALVTALCLAGDSMLYIVLPLFWQEAGFASLWEVGMILSVNRLARIPLNPLVGWIYTKISIKTGIILATCCALISSMGYATVRGLVFWVILRVLWGGAWSLLKLGAFATIVDVSTDGNRGYLVGRYNGLYRLGSLAGMLGGGILADMYGLHLTAYVCAALALPAVLISFLYIPSAVTALPGKKKTRVAWRDLLSSSGGIVPALGTAFLVAFTLQGILASTLGPLVKSHLGDSVTLVGFAVGCASVAGFLQALRWGWEPWLAPWFGKLSDGPQGRSRLMACSLLGSGIVFALASVHAPALIWLLGIAAIQFSATAICTLSDAVVTDVAEVSSHRMMMLTAYVMVADLGAALGPLAAMFVGQRLGFDSVYLGIGIVLASVSLLWMRRRGGQHRLRSES